MARAGAAAAVLAMLCAMSVVNVASGAGLVFNFYAKSCPKAESIIQQTVYDLYKYKQDNIATSFIRWSFHDFFNGADGSFLLKSKNFKSNSSEKDSVSQEGMRTDRYVTQVKWAVDKVCPGVVSCADVLAVGGAAAVNVLGGPKMKVKTGRRDSRVSYKASADKMPTPHASVSRVLAFFKGIGIGTEGAVALLGAHTIGRAHCVSFRDRVNPKFDPRMDKVFAQFLKDRCPYNATRVHFTYFRNDPYSPILFDNHYYVSLLKKRGLMRVDDNLIWDDRTLPIVQLYAKSEKAWRKAFAAAYIKVSELKPLTGKQGEIRRDCSYINKLP